MQVVSEPGAQRKQRSGQALPAGIVVDAVAMCEVKRDSSDLGKAVTKSVGQGFGDAALILP